MSKYLLVLGHVGCLALGERRDGVRRGRELPAAEVADRLHAEGRPRVVGVFRDALERRRRQRDDLLQRLALVRLVERQIHVERRRGGAVLGEFVRRERDQGPGRARSTAVGYYARPRPSPLPTTRAPGGLR